MRVRALLVASAAALFGCAPALSGFQPAHVAEKGHVQAELGMDVAIPTGGLGDLVDAAEVLAGAARERQLTDGERRTLFNAGAALATNAPSPLPHVGVAFTPLTSFEIGLRYSGSALRGGLRYQFLRRAAHGVDLSAGLGVARYTFEFPVSSVLGILEIEDFERWQFDLPILVGTSQTWYRLWGGPRLMFTTFGTQMNLSLPAIPGVSSEEQEIAAFDGTGFYVGAQGGVAFGYKYVFFGVELTLAQLFASAELTAFGEQVHDVDLDSFVISPGFALMGEF
jgi:hypothetical protein